MLPGSGDVATAIQGRVDELNTFGATAARPLVEEEEMLQRTVGWYRERGGDQPLIDAVTARLQAVRDQLEHVLPLWEEAQLLERVLRLYERQRLGEQDPGRFRVIRQQIRHLMEVERRKIAGSRPIVDARNWSALHVGPLARERPAATEDDGDETAVERTARSQTVQERVGRFAREYLDVTRGVEVPFPTLYEAVIDYAVREWPNSSDRARIENFRYALKRAAPMFGLSYDQGVVRRADPANAEEVRR
jgi:hypothetical protein